MAVAGFGSFGFSGSRSLAGAQAALCQSLARAAVRSGASVLTGCAPGADLAARVGAGPAAQVFRVSGGPGHLPRSAFALRSVEFVRTLAGSPSPVLVSFPGRPCPAGLGPSASSRICFSGFGSGSWSSAAFAAGLGVPVVVFGLPASSLPPWPGRWEIVRSGLLAGGSQFCPAAVPQSAGSPQVSLF